MRARISHMDSAHRYDTSLGVDVYIGQGRRPPDDRVVVEGPSGDRILSFVKAAVCTGASALPPHTRAGEAGYLTNDTVFSLTELPRRMAVIGAGTDWM